MVKTVKQQSPDPYLALLNYRATPLPWCKRSPAELLMGRRIRTRVPCLKEQLVPAWPYLKEFQKQNEKFKAKQKSDYDKRHRVRDLDILPSGTNVWITSDGERSEGTIIGPDDSPRSYHVSTPTGTVRRNRLHLNAVPPPAVESHGDVVEPSPEPARIITRSQTGTIVKPPERLYA